MTPDQIVQRRQQAGAPAWADGDIFIAVYQGEADEVLLGGGIQLPPWRVGESDLWVAMARVRDLPQCVIGYFFLPLQGDQPVPNQGQSGVWRGAEAPPAPERAAALAGRLREHRLEQRAVFGFSNGGAFALAMGQRHPDRFGQVLDNAIWEEEFWGALTWCFDRH